MREEDGGSADPQKLAKLEGIQRSVLVSVPAFLRDLEGCPMTSIYCVNHPGTTMALPGGMEAREGYRGVTAANGSLAPGKLDLCLRSLRSKVHLRYSRRMSPLNTHDREAWFEGPSARCEVTLAGVQPAWSIVLLGAPGAGKATQADLLTQRLRACHLYFYGFLRATFSAR